MTSKKSKKLKRIKHYNSSQNILLVGEGDFSFSACLAKAFGSATNMVATSRDSRRTVLANHWASEAHLDFLEENLCFACHFPHLTETDSELIKKHQKLVKAFFRSARQMVSGDGEVHVTHRDDHPYNQWNLEELVEDSGLVLKEKFQFLQKDYPGYQNKRGGGIKSNKKFPLGASDTFKFSVAKNSEEEEAEYLTSHRVALHIK